MKGVGWGTLDFLSRVGSWNMGWGAEGGVGCRSERGMADTGHKPPDKRLEWFQDRILSAWGRLTKPDKAQKLIETETTSKALQTYCDSDSRSIFIYEQDGDFVASQLAPQNSKSKKVVSFIKEDVPIQDAKVRIWLGLVSPPNL
eukprot:765479-Hanusia_phi.AAC.3